MASKFHKLFYSVIYIYIYILISVYLVWTIKSDFSAKLQTVSPEVQIWKQIGIGSNCVQSIRYCVQLPLKAHGIRHMRRVASKCLDKTVWLMNGINGRYPGQMCHLRRSDLSHPNNLQRVHCHTLYLQPIAPLTMETQLAKM